MIPKIESSQPKLISGFKMEKETDTLVRQEACR